MSAAAGFSFTAPFDLYAELQRLNRIADAIGASTETASNYDEAARELVSRLRGVVTEGIYLVGHWISADDVNRLVREIDVALNGVGAATQANLCDIAAQVKKAAGEFGPILQVIGKPPKHMLANSDDWAIAAAFREVTGPNGGLIKNEEVVDFISTRAREMMANVEQEGLAPRSGSMQTEVVGASAESITALANWVQQRADACWHEKHTIQLEDIARRIRALSETKPAVDINNTGGP